MLLLLCGMLRLWYHHGLGVYKKKFSMFCMCVISYGFATTGSGWHAAVRQNGILNDMENKLFGGVQLPPPPPPPRPNLLTQTFSLRK